MDNNEGMIAFGRNAAERDSQPMSDRLRGANVYNSPSKYVASDCQEFSFTDVMHLVANETAQVASFNN